MTSRLFKNIVFLGIVILLTVVSVFIFKLNENYQAKLYDDMREEAQLAMNGVAYGGIEYLESLDIQNRITWINTDGSVLYDSYDDSDYSENHAGREEVAEAMKFGEGVSERYSDSLQETFLYYAVRAHDGTIMRISAEKRLINKFVYDVSLHLVWISLLIILGGMLIAYQITKRLVEPLNQMAFYDPAMKSEYPELKPLLTRLEEQNRTIGEQMRELMRKEREFTAITENMREGFVLFDNHGNAVDIYDRMDAVDEIAPDLLLSIHQNSMPQNSDISHIRGVVGLYWTESGRSLADCVAEEIAIALGRLKRDTTGQRLAMLRNYKFPSALIEIGFVTSAEEFEALVAPGGIELTAQAIADGVLKWFETQQIGN